MLPLRRRRPSQYAAKSEKQYKVIAMISLCIFGCYVLYFGFPNISTSAFPVLAGFGFGFFGSIPVAGPTSAMILKLGIQGNYNAGQAVACGGALAEAMYAGVSFWGFGSFLSGIKILLPISKVLGAVVLLGIGSYFVYVDFRPTLKKEGKVEKPKDDSKVIVKHVLLGMTMSGINPALIATYTAAIATVYGTGLLVFRLWYAVLFGLGVWMGIFSWFVLLLHLLAKYKQKLETATMGKIMKGMGALLIICGLYCVLSSIVYFAS